MKNQNAFIHKWGGVIIMLSLCTAIGLFSWYLNSRNVYGSAYYCPNLTYTDVTSDHSWLDTQHPLTLVDPSGLDAAYQAASEKSYIKSLLVIQHGTLVREAYFKGGSLNNANNIHSASKSIISALVGIALENGDIKSLDDPISKYLPSDYFDDSDTAVRHITIKQLLTMTAGLDWDENVTEYKLEHEKNWVKAILSQELVNKPGESFNYSTGLVQVMSAVLTHATQTDLMTYANHHLFGPMGITVDHWQKDPNAYYMGGCDFFITPIEMAKFGQLYLNHGMWKGQQIVSESWVNQSFTSHVLDASDDEFNYGYYWWLNSVQGHDVKTAWGYAGQMIHVIPDLDAVVVMTTESNNKNCDENISFVLLKDIIPSLAQKND